MSWSLRSPTVTLLQPGFHPEIEHKLYVCVSFLLYVVILVSVNLYVDSRDSSINQQVILGLRTWLATPLGLVFWFGFPPWAGRKLSWAETSSSYASHSWAQLTLRSAQLVLRSRWKTQKKMAPCGKNKLSDSHPVTQTWLDIPRCLITQSWTAGRNKLGFLKTFLFSDHSIN